MKTRSRTIVLTPGQNRGGSTLVIVIALLGLLMFLGMVFYTFASQERAAAEYFTEAAKAEIDEPPNVFDHMLRHVISGPSDRKSERGSILRSPDRHHSIVSNLLGYDVLPNNGDSIRVIYDGSGRPVVDQNGDGAADPLAVQDHLDFVDSPAARLGNEQRTQARPAPDVDYTYPDLNNVFLAYRGTAVRDNGVGAIPRYETVPVIIPSFFRPQYMKSGNANGAAGENVLTDHDWATESSNRSGSGAPNDYSKRSFRPDNLHIAGFQADGVTPVYRYLTDAEAAGFGLASGGFPFLPEDDINSGLGTANRGELGIWTGSNPVVYELDADNDGDGIKEGIWLDLHFPLQEHTDSGGTLVKYVVLHSVTIYDLDSLIDLNVHGNLAGLDRNADFNAPSMDFSFQNSFFSRSNLGLSPAEINPLWALRNNTPVAGTAIANFNEHFGSLPVNDLEKANMEWMWLLGGRYQTSPLVNIFPGRWGEADRLYAMMNSGNTFVANMPRPGRTQNANQSISTGLRFGGDLSAAGRNGFDDNQDAREGEVFAGSGRIRGFRTPMDFAGTGRTNTATTTAFNAGTNSFTTAGDGLLPILHHDTASTGPERWLGFNGYSMVREVDTTYQKYVFGQNGVFDNGLGDDLIANPFLDPNFEDAMESIFDQELAERDYDQVFGPGDVPALQLSGTDLGAAISSGLVTSRMNDLAPVALSSANQLIRERFTTVSNSFRKFMYRHQLGPDLRYGTADDGPRAWENTADSDGADNNNDGIPDGDGFLEFPPAFGPVGSKIAPYSAKDPFRPQARRMLTSEIGDTRPVFGQLPLSINHILDVERNPQTPQEGTARFLQYMQRTGLRFRPLTEHPDLTEGNTVLTANTLPTWSAASPVAYPPTTVGEREFWARRDRQKMARDIFVLLYTTGGAQLLNATNEDIIDYTGTNDPNATAPGVNALYSHAQLRKMAQFAVNLVDAMDTDNVITRFEYDKNLGNGWDLDDDLSTNDGFVPLTNGDPNYDAATGRGMYPEDSNERGVVYGVEAQELAFSEVQGIRSPEISAGDHESTPYDDSDFARDFIHVELQNLSPVRVNLATSATNAATNAVWRIGRYDRTGNTDPLALPTAPDRSIAFMNHADNAINGGGRFSIATSSDTGLACSAFFIDTGVPASGMWDGTYELVAPDANLGTLPTSANTAGSGDMAYADPLFDLDLIHVDHNTPANSRFVQTGGDFLSTTVNYGGNQTFSPPTDQFDGDFAPAGATGGFDLVIQRRLNPHMPSLPEVDNPWIEVDRIKVVLKNFNINDSSTPTDVFDPTGPSGRLTEIQSEERSEPLSDRTRTASAVSPNAAYRYNSMKGGLNAANNDMRGVNVSKIGGQFNVRQDHFDRDFASPVELLNLPVVGPNLLTQRLERMRFPAYQQAYPSPTSPTPGSEAYELLSSAESLILGPDFPDTGTLPVTQADSVNDNRWYRLFQFVEVPSRVHRMLGNYVQLERLPGKLNINMLRHLEVFAGMVDHPRYGDTDADRNLFPFLTDSSPLRTATTHPILGGDMAAGVQDRWIEYLTDRDGVSVSYDPVNSRSAHFWVPGTPNAQPFRSMAFTTGFRSENGLNSTFFRNLRADRVDGAPETNRNWLEVGSRVVHQAPLAYTTATQRHQILSKLMNNTTTVSNTFVMFATAAYFEAYEDPATGLVRVGGRYDLDEDGDPDNDQQRAVFVIDRTEALKAYNPGTREVNWERLIKHRVQID